MEALLAFAAALLTFRLAALVLRRRGRAGGAHLLAWGASLLAFAVASGALAWAAAAGWSGPAFRVYYLFGGLLTAALLGAGSLLLAGVRAAGPAALVYAGLAVGTMLAVPLTEPVSGTAIPDAREHLALFPARILALTGNLAGTAAVVGVALLTLRRRPLGNALIVAGVLVAAGGSALFGLGAGSAALTLALAAVLLYAGFVARPGRPAPAAPDREPDQREEQERQRLGHQAGGAPVRQRRPGEI